MRYLITLFCISISLLSCREDSAQPLPSLVGEWQLVGFANGQGQIIETQPNSQTKPVTIEFVSDTIKGDFGVNYLSARYRVLDDSTLVVSALTYTEGGGSPWEMKFISNFPRDTAHYQVEKETLVLFPKSVNNQGPFTDDTPTVYQSAK